MFSLETPDSEKKFLKKKLSLSVCAFSPKKKRGMATPGDEFKDVGLDIDAEDRKRLSRIFNLASEFFEGHQYEGSLREDRIDHSVLVEFENITTQDDPVDLFFLFNVVEQCKPFIRECTVSWNKNTASHLDISIELFKNTTGPSPPRGPTYQPLCPQIDVHLKKHLVDSNFEMRNTPSEWAKIYPKLETISKAMYTRGEDIPTPSESLSYGSGVDSVILDFANNESVTYSFLEHLTQTTGVVGVEARGEDSTISYCVDGTSGTSFPTRF